MSTSPDANADASARGGDLIVGDLSQWLARHIDRDELLRRVETIGTNELGDEQAEAVEELLEALRGGRDGGELEMIVREALESLALGR